MFRFWEKNQCRKVQQRLSEYIDGYLGPEERRWVEHHLETCPNCRSELDSLKGTVELLRAVPSVNPPRSFALARAPVPAELAPRLFRPTILSTATAMVALLLVLVMAGSQLRLFEPGPVAFHNQTPTPTITQDISRALAETPEIRTQADAGTEKAVVPPGLTPMPTPAPAGEASPAVALGWVEIGLALVVVILAGLTVFASLRGVRPGRG